MLDLFSELLSVAKVMKEGRVPFALVGGLAYSLLVEIRATEDIDLLIHPSDWERVPALLEPLGYLNVAGPMDFAKIRIRRLTKLTQPDVLVLDFLLADGEFSEGLRRAVQIAVRGESLPVAPPDVIIALKKERMSDKDRSDIAGLRRLLEGGNAGS